MPSNFIPEWKTGENIQIEGSISGNRIVFQSDKTIQPTSFSYKFRAEDIPILDTQRTTGDKRLAVIMIRKSDDIIPPESIDLVREAVFTDQDSISNWYKKISFVQLRLSGDIFGWYLADEIGLVGDLGGCPKDHLDEISTKINDFAHNRDNFDYNSYDYVSYVLSYLPYDYQCLGAGFAILGGKNSFINIHIYNTSAAPDLQAYSGRNTLKHELGHNLGLNHARLLVCNGGQMADYMQCNTVERDLTDIMGGGWLDYANFNEMHGINRLSLGWVPEANIIEIAPSINPQNVRLYRLNKPNNDASKRVVFKIKKTGNPTKPENYEYYYLSYIPIPIFENMIWRDGGMRGASLHLTNDLGCSQDYDVSSCMVDITPNSAHSNTIIDSMDAYFLDQSIFTDNIAQVRITQLAHNDDYADLQIEYPYNGPVTTPTNTPIPQTNTPIPPSPTPIPTNTSTPPPSCSNKSQGDANCDGKISGLDYVIWLNTQCNPEGMQNCKDLRADFNKDNKVNNDDYNIWFANSR